MTTLRVTPDATGFRLDIWLSQTVSGPSRARWQVLIREGLVRVDGEPRKPGYLLRGEEVITYILPAAEPATLSPEEIPLDILYEDPHVLAVNKPPGLVIHPAPGHATGTLVNALLHHCHDLEGIGGVVRPGIVHRLDKDTSGVLAVAKTEVAMLSLSAQFKQREVRKEYLALVWGVPVPASGTIDAPIARATVNRKKMSIDFARGKPATSHYRVEEKIGDHALVRVHIETGRTHQIRVHLAHIGYPLVGDPLYGRRKHDPASLFPRQMLHAQFLGVVHPVFHEPITFHAPMPEDMRTLIQTWRTG